MEITIIGKGGFAREVQAYIKGLEPIYTVKLITSDEYNGEEDVLVAISDPNIRQRIVKEINHKSEYIVIDYGKDYGNITRGEGTIICPECILTTNIGIGKHCQFNIQTSIGHDSNIGDFVTTAPKVSISGNVTIGNRVYIGTGAIIKEKTYICDDVIIGAGAVVLNDITQPGTYVGIPAKKIK
jgi:sugar O-acyltransferase (sialic acid O-acetyltransferase NeuD family)